jgi:sulfotransferase family protein
MRFSDRYGPIERALHYLAFSVPFVQKALAELENDLFARERGRSQTGREVFITGLPRAGTTLLLELLYRTGEFCSFTYRHMPFVLSPLIFGRASRANARSGGAIERAHGDGMQVSLDSPEAFEEVLWLAYLRDRIVTDRTIEPLTIEMVSAQFEDAFRATIQKLLAERGGVLAARYLSKNNANISRLRVLSELFPNSTVIVAFREPAVHTASLMRQHLRFSAAHSTDAFARRYMAWIGHFEFGLNFRPINFSGWLDGDAVEPIPTADFWLRYWTAAYRHALEHRTRNVVFVDFDRLLAEKALYLATIGRALDLRRPEALVEQAERLRAPTTTERAASGSDETLQAALEVHAELCAAAVPSAPRVAND